ncbi:glycopeptide antibiotics resistance protein [Microbacteriaceae bacterium SG_E_30_P1]|uniref:Glycopeptide antibiotics resistance protein n=1 Tax=Antiquaquibacter oligotrophicus TaxID=2880260 RepID=A0ABT6KNB3_9MICO|nr:VanZ family protein [Antiquaquibacter oligotrophicus]MDH6180654.1 glycopeptide antibiotics resistance protein [Antiquaquibacter oligotrophicus]UDF13618.1 VanZ family protein [Antiquaquibacter oligotrophicus]
MFARHPYLSLATFVYLGVVGWATLTPQSGRASSNLLWRMAEFFDRYEATQWLTFSTLEFLANIAMFVPLGLFFVLLLGRRRWWLAIALGFLLTMVIEFVQQFIGGRVPDVRDIVANSLGAILGTLLALVLTAAAARKRRAGRVSSEPIASRL